MKTFHGIVKIHEYSKKSPKIKIPNSSHVTLPKQADMTSSFILIRNLKSALNYTFCWPYNPLDADPELGATKVPTGTFSASVKKHRPAFTSTPGGAFRPLTFTTTRLLFYEGPLGNVRDKNGQMRATDVDTN